MSNRNRGRAQAEQPAEQASETQATDQTEGGEGAVLTDAEREDGGDQTDTPGTTEGEDGAEGQETTEGEAAETGPMGGDDQPPAKPRRTQARRPRIVTGFGPVEEDVPLPAPPETTQQRLRGLERAGQSFHSGTSGLTKAALTRAANAVGKETGAKFDVRPEGDRFRVFRLPD